MNLSPPSAAPAYPKHGAAAASAVPAPESAALPRPNRRLFLISSAIGWGAFYVLRTALVVVRCIKAPGISMPAALALDLANHLACMGASIFVWYWMTHRRLVEKGWARTSIEGFLVATLLNIGLTAASILPFRAIYSAHLGETSPYEATILHLMSGPLWFALVLAFVYFDHTCGLERLRAQSESTARETQLQLLRGQVNPHFLFNSFNSLRALISIDPRKAGNALEQITDILRYSLTGSQPKLVSVAEELAAIQQYLALEQLRLGPRLELETEIEPGVETCAIPPLALQGLVENAVKHGPARLRKGGRVHYLLKREHDTLVAIVSNTGSLTGESLSTRLGLRNLRERLRLLYGGAATLSLAEKTATLVVAELRIPFHSVHPSLAPA